MDETLAFALTHFRKDQYVLREKENPVKAAVNDAFLTTVIAALDCGKRADTVLSLDHKEDCKEDILTLDSIEEVKKDCNNDLISIVVKTMIGKSLPLKVPKFSTVSGLKRLIQDKEGIAPAYQRLIFAGTQMKDLELLMKYNITNNSVVYLVLRMRGGCFVASTLITMSDGYTKKRIEDIVPGDRVLSTDTATFHLGPPTTHIKLCSGIVLETFRQPRPPALLVKVSFFGGCNETSAALICTANHPFWVIGKGWASFDPILTPHCESQDVFRLQPGDQVVGEDGKHRYIKMIDVLHDREEPVYNIAVESTHCYFAGGLLAHNTTDPEVRNIAGDVGNFMDVRWNRAYGPEKGSINWKGDLKDGRDRGSTLGFKYICPVGWKKYGIRVNCVKDGKEFDAKFKGWPVAYHGTAGENAVPILQSGFHANTGCFSQGIKVVYFSPSIRYVSHARYAKITRKNKKYIQMVFQCRINPKWIWKKGSGTVGQRGKQIDPNYKNNEIEWLVKPPNESRLTVLDNDMFICYAIMIRESDKKPAELDESSWW